MTGACEHENEPLGSVNGGKFIYQLTDYQIFKEDSAP
jgi:hypothetical protein